ncbi:MAG: DegQ family serine endoprotease [Ectothiorhodospiraceae bacterium]|jgi:Do/DeqQ family serine protease
MRNLLVGLFSLALTMGAIGLQPAAAGIPPVTADGQTPSLAPMIQKVSPAVVNISTKGHVQVQRSPLLNDPFFRRFFDVPDQPQQRQVQALGSGVIVDADKGYIITNHHVIANADKVKVTLQDNREFDADIVGSDPETDVAVIRIDADNLSQIPLADSKELRVGDYVVAIGNPFGLDHTVTTGVVSGLGRVLHGGEVNSRLQNFIQTDASINPGNSGGALVNLRGELVGINAAILSRSGGNIGIGFAIPINMARQIMDQLVSYGEVRRGVLGVRIQDLTPDIADAFGIKRKEGALVAQVSPGSAADEAGIQQGDVIVKVNGETVDNANDLANAIGLLQIGDEVDLQLIRDGDRKEITAKVGDPSDREASAQGMHPALEGAKFSELDERSPLFGKVDGVMVTAVADGSKAARYLQAGDVITSVNRQQVHNLAEFRQAVQGSDRLLLNIRRGNGAMFVLVK